MSDFVHLLPFSQNALSFLAKKILDTHRDDLPNLSNCVVLVNQPHCAPRLRNELLKLASERGVDALLGIRIETFSQWLTESSHLEEPILNRAAQELVLADALRNTSGIYENTDPWLLSRQLLTLFDELTRCGQTLPETIESFEHTLQVSYGLDAPNPSLHKEAWMVHTLWTAWREQLENEQVLDAATAYHKQLSASLSTCESTTFWLAGFTQFSPAEISWIGQLRQTKQIHIILHGGAACADDHPDAPLTRIIGQLAIEELEALDSEPAPLEALIDCLFSDSQTNIKERALAFGQQTPDPLAHRLAYYDADSPEQEAQAITLQIRRWLLEGLGSIAIISEDRLLDRRVRALLETAGVGLNDAGGWALSTTSAAATLERWLEAVEEDFACAPLLDLLKSPFVYFGNREEHLTHVQRFEQDIILHENIARSLHRYRFQLDRRSERLPGWSEPARLAVHQLLNQLDHASSTLIPLLQNKHPADTYLGALETSLKELGAWQCFANDEAGQTLLDAIGELRQAAQHSSISMRWAEFRNWLGHQLESGTFRSNSSANSVRLLTYEQSLLQRFDAVILAGCSSEKLPGSPATSAFFNQRVRAALGLHTWSDSRAQKLHQFCHSLHCADRLLITWHKERDGEAVEVSPWIELLRIFYRNAYANDLKDFELDYLLHSPQSFPSGPDCDPLPDTQTRPTPPTLPALLPQTWSASTHQRIIDCPYRFFVADILGLKPADEIREALDRSDYGSLIHRILQAFHSNVDSLSGPWGGPISSEQSEPALLLLEKISREVFNYAVEENFQARAWLKQWLMIAPGYIDWEITRQQSWKPHKVERSLEREITPQLMIKGRVDRIDQQPNALSIIDYKTGTAPDAEEVMSGEAVQLATYALLSNANVQEIDYLQLKGSAELKVCAEGEPLSALLEATQARMKTIDHALLNGADLPAWGNPKVCAYCELDGLCRRPAWIQSEQSSA